MCSLRFENNILTFEGVRFASISKKTPLSKLSFAFVSLALPLLVDMSPSKVSLRLPIAKMFSRKANGTRGAIMPRQQVVFYDRFLNKYFMIGQVEL